MSISVLLADDHKIMRQGLKVLLEQESDIEVVAKASNGLETVQMAQEYAPDVIVMDMNMPELNGIESTRSVLASNPSIKIIILTMVLDRVCILEALKAGATGYVLKDCAADELVMAIRTVAAGFPYLCREVTAMVIEEYTRDDDDVKGGLKQQLSGRELEVLKLLAEGRNSKEIAFTIGVSVKTVEAQRTSIMKKLNLHSVAELTKFAIREGLTPLD